LSASAFAKDDINWYRVSANTLIVADWIQTRQVVNNPNYYEANPLIGKDPTLRRVNNHFILVLLATNIIGEKFMGNQKNMWYGINASVKLVGVLHNYQLGITFKY